MLDSKLVSELHVIQGVENSVVVLRSNLYIVLDSKPESELGAAGEMAATEAAAAARVSNHRSSLSLRF